MADDTFNQTWSPKVRRWTCEGCGAEYSWEEAQKLRWHEGYRCACGAQVRYVLGRLGS